MSREPIGERPHWTALRDLVFARDHTVEEIAAARGWTYSAAWSYRKTMLEALPAYEHWLRDFAPPAELARAPVEAPPPTLAPPPPPPPPPAAPLPPRRRRPKWLRLLFKAKGWKR